MSVLNDSLYDELDDKVKADLNARKAKNDESYFKNDESYFRKIHFGSFGLSDDITESDEPFPIINRYFKIYD